MNDRFCSVASNLAILVVMPAVVMLAAAGATGCRSAPAPAPEAPMLEPAAAYEAGRQLVEAGQVVEAWPFFQHAALMGDEALRAQADAELFALGVRVYDEEGDRCQVLDASLTCDRALFGCSNTITHIGEEGGEATVQIAFGYEVEELVFEENEIEQSDVPRLTWHTIEECFADRCQARALEQVSCDALESVAHAAEQCALAQEACEDEDENDVKQCAEYPACFEQACEQARQIAGALAAEPADEEAAGTWPELVTELEGYAIATCEDCTTVDRLRCEVVFAEACTGRAAVVCEHQLEDLEGFEENLVTLSDGREVLVFETGFPEEPEEPAAR